MPLIESFHKLTITVQNKSRNTLVAENRLCVFKTVMDNPGSKGGSLFEIEVKIP